ncbi:MAG TPA: hypothetical protein VGZ32_22105 [Actinocrinis sp.]|jgi:arylamine N-acetyltransferase|nr:hypothetical protein [Actinocrinis sp.]HEV3173056.1 hypothetical protein [Actinocrinis sp.]
MDSLDAAWVAAYLDRIGAPAQQPDAAYLRILHRLHLDAVPFENLSIHLGRASSWSRKRSSRRSSQGGAEVSATS